ncbi:MAG: hypothetical protein BWY21_00941 [Parcubacteria group bacterium ADurb.Bin216]|nr:MAG: hypothetical protein BWY21_00941 [Parcubacteria group bacterium ADurb.Bin216]
MKYLLLLIVGLLVVGCNVYRPSFVVKEKRILHGSKTDCKFMIDTKTLLYDKEIELYYVPCDCFDVGDTIQFTKVSAKDSNR